MELIGDDGFKNVVGGGNYGLGVLRSVLGIDVISKDETWWDVVGHDCTLGLGDNVIGDEDVFVRWIVGWAEAKNSSNFSFVWI